MQINCKLGGDLWATKIPIEGLMVVGIDIFKDKAGKSGRMLAGIVSSLTPAHTKFYSQVINKFLLPENYFGGVTKYLSCAHIGGSNASMHPSYL